MRQDFAEPQKQAAVGIIIMFLHTFQAVFRALILPFIFVIFRSGENTTYFVLIAFAIISVLLAFFSYLSYQNFTFFLDGQKQEFVINEGVFNKTSLTIQLNKIQQVNIKQSLIQQITGVYSLEIDTAGTDKKEAKIKAIDHQSATILKQKLLNRDKTEYEEQQDISENEVPPFLKLSFTTLLKIGITSNYGASILLLTGFLFASVQMLNDFKRAYQDGADQIHKAIEQSIGLFSIGFFIIAALIIILATNIIRTFFRYYNFEIVRQKNALTISSGLFNKNNTLLKPNKVQISTYSQNYFQKKFDLINMKIKQASYHADEHKQNKKSDLEIPGCDERERDEILKMIYDRIPQKGLEYLPDYRFLFLQVMIYIVLPVLIFTGLGLFAFNLPHQYFYYEIPYVILVFTALYFEYKHHRIYVNADFIIKKKGIWDVEYEFIEPYKIQSITTKQYFWHKKADIGHLTIHTAGGRIHFSYGNYTEIHDLVNYWMYKIQSSGRDWM